MRIYNKFSTLLFLVLFITSCGLVSNRNFSKQKFTKLKQVEHDFTEEQPKKILAFESETEDSPEEIILPQVVDTDSKDEVSENSGVNIEIQDEAIVEFEELELVEEDEFVASTPEKAETNNFEDYPVYDQWEDFFRTGLAFFILGAIVTTLAIIFLLYYNWILGLLLFTPAGIFLLVAWIKSWRMVNLSKAYPEEINAKTVSNFKTKLILAKLLAWGGIVVIALCFLLVLIGL